MTPFVSVIIPAFNAQAFISDTIESVIGQSYQNWELIVVDDCSVDLTIQIVKRFSAIDPRIKLLTTPSNSGGPAFPRNMGMGASQGDLIALLDADDIWHFEKLRIQVDAYNLTKTKMLSTGMTDFTLSRPTRHDSPLAVAFRSITLNDQLIKYRTPTSSLMLHRDLLNYVKFNESPWLRGREDLEFSIRVHNQFGHSLKVETPLVFYRRHREQLSRSKFRMFMTTFWVILSTNLGRYNVLKLMLPLYIASNIWYSIYYRIIRGSL